MVGMVPEPWLGVEPRHLATFVSVADAGSFRAAAARLGYVQSAVSQQISQLERALSTRLIERGQGNRELVLTVAGQTLLGHARRIVDEVRAACADISYLTGESPISVALEPAATSLLAVLAPRLSTLGADTPLTVSEAPANALAEMVASGTVDFAVGALGSMPPGLSRQVLHTDSWSLVTPATSQPAQHGVDSLAALRGLRIIKDRSHPLPIGRSQLEIEHQITCDRLSIALDLVRAGAGNAILPTLAAPNNDPRLSVIDLSKLLPPRIVSLAWLRARRLPDIPATLNNPDNQRQHPIFAVA